MGVADKASEYIPHLGRLSSRRAKGVRALDIVVALLMIILGAVTIFFSKSISHYLHWIVGVILWGISLMLFVLYFHYKEYVNPRNGEYMLAWFLLVAGILIVSVPSRSIVVISVIWGLWSIVKSVRELNEQIQLKRQHKRILFKTLISLFELVMGTILLMELTDEAIGHHVVILGISFISHGIQDLNAVFSRDYDNLERVAAMREGLLSVVKRASKAANRVADATSARSFGSKGSDQQGGEDSPSSDNK